MSALGERLVTRYLAHPPAASSWWQNGDALDSGSGQIVDSDITHLEFESPRIIAEVNGPGSTAGYQNGGDPWSGLADVAPPASITTWGIAASSIPWDRRTAHRVGPFPLIADADASSGVVVPRTLGVRVDAVIDAAITTRTALFALTTSPSAQLLAEGRYLVFKSVAFAGTGAQTVTTTLQPTDPLAPEMYEPMRVRAGSASGDAFAYVVRGYLWFGWLFLGATTNNVIVSLSAWETR